MSTVLAEYFRHVTLRFERGWRHPALGYCPFHRHPAFEIVLHARGSGKTRDSTATTTTFAQGGIVVYLPNTGHDQSMGSPGEDVCVHVGGDLAPPPQLPGTLYVPPAENAGLREQVEELAAGLPNLTPLQQLAYDHRAAALLIELLQAAEGALGTQEATADRYAALAHDYVFEHLRSLGSLPEVADAIGISHDYLRHCFRRRYGVGLKAWHTAVRVERAKDLLVNSNLPLKVIADICGFANARYFSTCFRRVTRTTPAAYRRQNTTASV